MDQLCSALESTPAMNLYHACTCHSYDEALNETSNLETTLFDSQHHLNSSVVVVDYAEI
jgi:hypothetical protein